MRSAATMLLLLAGCPQQDSDKPPKLEGQWELMQIETAQGEIDGAELVLSQFPGCAWARRTYKFTGDKLAVENDILCRSKARAEYYGCQVAAEVPAQWDEASGAWIVATPVRARARTKALEEGALDVPTSCTVEIAAGNYPVMKVRGQKWRWEMGAPDGTVYRLRVPDTDQPDFVLAMRESREKAEAAKAEAEGAQQ